MFRRLFRSNLIRRNFGFHRPIPARKSSISTAHKAFAAVGVVGTTAVVLTAYYLNLKEIGRDALEYLPKALEKAKLEIIEPDMYVERKDLVDQFKEIQNSSPKGEYFVVYGRKGVGKSTAVHNTFSGMDAVVELKIASNLSKNQISQQIAEKILERPLPHGAICTTELLESIHKCDTTPTIIFDVEIADSEDQLEGLNTVRSFAKELAGKCHCIILLSQESAILSFEQYPDRESVFIFVGEMTNEEATLLLKKNDVHLSTEDLRHIFAYVGKSPNKLKHLSTKLQMNDKGEIAPRTLKKVVDELEDVPSQETIKAEEGHSWCI